MIGRRADPPPRSPLSRWVESASDPGHLTVDAVVAFVDGELPEPSALRATTHVARCLSCAAEVAAQRQARVRLRGAEAPDVPSSLLSSLRAIPDTAALDALGAECPGETPPGPPGAPTDGGLLRRWGGRLR